MFWRFQLAGVPFSLQTTSDDIQLPDAYHAFRCDGADAAGRYHVVSPDDQSLLPVDESRILWQCLTWRMGYLDDFRLCIEINNVEDNSWVPVVNVVKDFSMGVICPRYGRWATSSVYAVNYPYDQALLLNRLLFFEAGIVHACGVVVDGNGYVFTGPSDVGKTTLARLWQQSGATLLNDDRVILRVMDGVPYLAATPWHGEEPEVNAMTVPLKGIFFLQQSDVNRISDIPHVAAVSRLVANSVAPFYNQSAMEKLLGIWSQIVDQVQIGILSFIPDQQAIDVCLSSFAE